MFTIYQQFVSLILTVKAKADPNKVVFLHTFPNVSQAINSIIPQTVTNMHIFLSYFFPHHECVEKLIFHLYSFVPKSTTLK